MSLAISGVWVVSSAFLKCPDQGGRGGAISVAIALFALFANEPHGADLFELLSMSKGQFREKLGFAPDSAAPEPDEIRLKRLLDAIETRLNVDARGQDRLNIYMAVSSAFGTIVWGFGDWMSWGLARLLHIDILSAAAAADLLPK